MRINNAETVSSGRVMSSWWFIDKCGRNVCEGVRWFVQWRYMYFIQTMLGYWLRTQMICSKFRLYNPAWKMYLKIERVGYINFQVHILYQTVPSNVCCKSFGFSASSIKNRSIASYIYKWWKTRASKVEASRTFSKDGEMCKCWSKDSG